jgi:hypothetical protein
VSGKRILPPGVGVAIASKKLRVWKISQLG